jgi:hypothetical protein
LDQRSLNGEGGEEQDLPASGLSEAPAQHPFAKGGTEPRAPRLIKIVRGVGYTFAILHRNTAEEGALCLGTPVG